MIGAWQDINRGQQMKVCGMLGVWALVQMLAPQMPAGTVVFDFKNTNGYDIVNYKNRLSVMTRDDDGERAILFKNENEESVAEKRYDTSWSVTTPRFSVRNGRIFAVKVRTKSDILLKTTKPMSSVLWYASDGKELLAQDALGQDSPVTTPMPIRTCATAYRDSAISDMVPEGAAFASVRICLDFPNVAYGQSVAVSRIEYVEKEDGVPWEYGDLAPPTVERLTPSPNRNFSSSVSFRIKDPSGVAKVSVSLDGKDITKSVTFSGDVVTYVPTTPWGEDSIH